jgi:hypothetical protein
MRWLGSSIAVRKPPYAQAVSTLMRVALTSTALTGVCP